MGQILSLQLRTVQNKIRYLSVTYPKIKRIYWQNGFESNPVYVQDIGTDAAGYPVVWEGPDEEGQGLPREVHHRLLQLQRRGKQPGTITLFNNRLQFFIIVFKPGVVQS